jgi:hypothetical protein
MGGLYSPGESLETVLDQAVHEIYRDWRALLYSYPGEGAMAARYQHVTDPIRRTVAAQVGGLLWARRRGLGMTTETET